MQSCGTRSQTQAKYYNTRTLTFLFLHVPHPNLDFLNLTPPAFGNGGCPYCWPMIAATLAVISPPVVDADADGNSSILRNLSEPVE